MHAHQPPDDDGVAALVCYYNEANVAYLEYRNALVDGCGDQATTDYAKEARDLAYQVAMTAAAALGLSYAFEGCSKSETRAIRDAFADLGEDAVWDWCKAMVLQQEFFERNVNFKPVWTEPALKANDWPTDAASATGMYDHE